MAGSRAPFVPDVHQSATAPIAVDAMGGDLAPGPVIDGALAWARRCGGAIQLVGPADRLEPLLSARPDRADLAIAIVPAAEAVEMCEAPAAALRRKPDASIRVAMQQVAAGRARG